MNIEKTLEILIPTYNRQKDLLHSLQQLLHRNSPVRNCRITVLDNASEDDTRGVCLQMARQHANLRYIRHEKNIGMGANICAAMAMASLPYYWVVGDDDSYDFSRWTQVEEALSRGADCAVVADFTLTDESYPSLLNQLGLLSAGIYKTANVTSEVLQNAYANIMNMFPHLALVCRLVNDKKKFIVASPVAVWGTDNPDPDGKAYIRGSKDETSLCPRLKYMWLQPAWQNILQMLDDKQLRRLCMNQGYKYSKLSSSAPNDRKYIKNICKTNLIYFHGYYANIVDIFFTFSLKNKFWLLFYTLYFSLRKKRYLKEKSK